MFDGTQLDPATQLLITGRERVAAGWIQGNYIFTGVVGGGPRYCMLGALGWTSCVMVATDTQLAAANRLARAIDPNAGSSFLKSYIPSWNDNRARTLAEVLDTFDRAIANTFALTQPAFALTQPA